MSKRDKYIESVYNIMNQYISSRPVFIQTSAANEIIVGTKEEDDHLTILLRHPFLSDENDRLYILSYNGVVLDTDAIVISYADDGNLVQFYSDNDGTLQPILDFKIAPNQYIKIDMYDEDHDVYEVAVEEIPPWLMTNTGSLTMDIFPVIYTMERTDMVDNTLHNTTQVHVYFAAQFSPVLFDVISTPIDLVKSGIHDNKVNLIKSKIRTNKDIINVASGSVIVQDIRDTRALRGFVSNLFIIDELNRDHIKTSAIDNKINDSINIRYSHLLDDGISVIPYYEPILQYPIEEKSSPFLLQSDIKVTHKVEKQIKDDVNLINNLENGVYETDAAKINDLVAKKLSGKRIDRKRNSNLKYVKEMFENATKAAEAVKRLCNEFDSDCVYIYNYGALTTFERDNNIFTDECKKLGNILSLIGKSKGEK